MRLYGIGATAIGLMAAAFIACVGDDPSAGGTPTPANDAGGTSSSGGSSGDDGSSNEDSGGSTDAGVDSARCDKTKPFGDPTAMTGPINTADKNERAITMSEDELIAIVQQDGELLYTKRASKNDPFEPLTQDFMLDINTDGYESSPAISPDGKTLYFGRDGQLMVAHRETLVDSFPSPVNVVAVDAAIPPANIEATQINHVGSRIHWTSNDDDPTFIADRSGTGFATFVNARPLAGPLTSIAFSGDELTLYFTVPGDGGFVMKYATRPTTSAALGAQLDMPANLRNFDALHVTYDDCIIYVRTTAGSDAGKYDIWEARRPK